MEVSSSDPPQENIEIFFMLYQIEIALRELIIETLSNVEGQRWYKKCLPGDILDKYRESRVLEKQIPWTQFINHNPIYYVDFPDLRKIIENNYNWRKAFEPIFSRKEIMASTLSEIEPIRNKIAHNRKATSKDVAIVRGALSKLSTAIGQHYFDNLASRCTLAPDLHEQLVDLQKEATNSWLICRESKPLSELKGWKSVCNAWWFDDSYLSVEIDKIEEFFRLIVEYSQLPRLRGTGHMIENWVRSSNIGTKYAQAQAQFDSIFANA
jgi:hypothetical protein